jgi:hypothetical protein
MISFEEYSTSDKSIASAAKEQNVMGDQIK